CRFFVEERVRLLRLAGELAERLDPFAALFLGIEVVEALRGAAAALVPSLPAAPREADVQGRARQRQHRGYEVLAALDPRRVDDHVRRADLLQKRERLVA